MLGDLLGSAVTTIGEILGSKNQTVHLKVKHDVLPSSGTLIVKADKYVEPNEFISWQWNGVNLIK